MQLQVFLPNEILLNQTVNKITAEGQDGYFCLLPNHVDFLSALVPGLLFFETAEGEENFLGVDEGILVKCGHEVLVSVKNAVQGTDIETLKNTVEEKFQSIDEREQMTRNALAKLEASFIRGFIELGVRP